VVAAYRFAACECPPLLKVGDHGTVPTIGDSVAARRRWYAEPMSESPKKMIESLRKVLKRLHYPIEVMLVCVRWYAAYPLSLRHIEM
jgi:hypothetical protein